MCKCTPNIRTLFCGKPGCEWPPRNIEIVRDDIAEKLDEMSDLCEHWKLNRERGRNPTAIRAALLMLAEECTILTRANRQIEGLDAALCGQSRSNAELAGTGDKR